MSSIPTQKLLDKLLEKLMNKVEKEELLKLLKREHQLNKKNQSLKLEKHHPENGLIMLMDILIPFTIMLKQNKSHLKNSKDKSNEFIDFKINYLIISYDKYAFSTVRYLLI